MDSITKAYKLGYNAYIHNTPLTNNPFGRFEDSLSSDEDEALVYVVPDWIAWQAWRKGHAEAFLRFVNTELP